MSGRDRAVRPAGVAARLRWRALAGRPVYSRAVLQDDMQLHDAVLHYYWTWEQALTAADETILTLCVCISEALGPMPSMRHIALERDFLPKLMHEINKLLLVIFKSTAIVEST